MNSLISRVRCFELLFRAIHTCLISHNNSRDRIPCLKSQYFSFTSLCAVTSFLVSSFGMNLRWAKTALAGSSRINLDGQIDPGHKCLLLPHGHRKIWKDITTLLDNLRGILIFIGNTDKEKGWERQLSKELGRRTYDLLRHSSPI